MEVCHEALAFSNDVELGSLERDGEGKCSEAFLIFLLRGHGEVTSIIDVTFRS